MRDLAARGIPRNPDAIRCAQVALAVVLGELLFGKGVTLVGRAALDIAVERLGVVVSVDHQLPFDRDRLALVVVEVEAAAEATRGLIARRVIDRVGPDGDHPHRRVVLALFGLLFLLILVFLRPRKARRLQIERGTAWRHAQGRNHQQ